MADVSVRGRVYSGISTDTINTARTPNPLLLMHAGFGWVRHIEDSVHRHMITWSYGGMMARHSSALFRLGSAAVRAFSSEPKITKKTLPQLAKEIDLRGKPVLVRADLNLPRSKEDGTITDDTRARAVGSVRRLVSKSSMSSSARSKFECFRAVSKIGPYDARVLAKMYVTSDACMFVCRLHAGGAYCELFARRRCEGKKCIIVGT